MIDRQQKDLVLIRVEREDVERMRKDCLKLLLKDNPSLIGVRISDRMLFKRLVDYFM